MNTTDLAQTDDRTLVITRTFDAPPRFVFDAWTKPELVMRWWAPKSRGAEMVRVDADVRPGGAYRYVFRAHGHEMSFSGTYLEVAPPARLVYTQRFDPTAEAGEAMVAIAFEPHGERTRLVCTEVYPSAQVLRDVLATGMEHGMRETLDQLDALVASLAAA